TVTFSFFRGGALSKMDAATQLSEVSTAEPECSANKNRRRCPRSGLNLPVRVTGHDRRSGQLIEMTYSLSVSRAGVRLCLDRKVRHGQVVQLMLPLPLHMLLNDTATP